MPPYTTLPTPEGLINISYSPMSPPNWGIVAAQFHVFVYSNVRIALQALLQAATTIQAQRLERGAAELLGEHLLFRGNADVTHRLLPTRLRGPWRQPHPRERFGIGGSDESRKHSGNWYEDMKPTRRIEDSISELPEEEIHKRYELERAALDRASRIKEVAELDEFRQRAAVRHYGQVPSPLLDVSTSPEVAAFFATGAGSTAPAAGQIGMLWAIDLNFVVQLFTLKTSSIPGGEKMLMTEQRDRWGDNKKMFEDYGIVPARLEITSVELPFHRPRAQHARFFSITGDHGSDLPLKTELAWWSIIERQAYMCAFIQDGRPYENEAHNITAAALLPEKEPLAIALS
jgi:hypothetical protein